MGKIELPKITVVTPSYNQGQFLEETILSVLNQDYPNLEYMIIDGGSTDNSIEIIKKYEDQLAYWVSEPDKGQSDAINKGFKRATGEILAWLNSDDVYMPGALATVGEFFSRYPEVDMVYGNQYDIDEYGRIFRASRSLKVSKFVLLPGCCIPQPTTFFRKGIFEKVGFLDVNLKYHMDYDLFLRIALEGFKIVHIPKFLAKFRYHSQSKTVIIATVTMEFKRAMEEIRQRYWKDRLGIFYNPLKHFLRGYYYYLKKKLINIDYYYQHRDYYLKRYFCIRCF